MLEVSDMDESFVWFAMQLFSKAGHAGASLPVFINHSPEQFVYFDNKESISLSKRQREEFKSFQNISELFELDDEFFDEKRNQRIIFYSVELICGQSMRSQVANDVHMLLDSIISADATIVLFRHGDNFLLSMVGFGQKSILSDWYLIEDHFEEFIEKLHIANVSIKSAKEYFFDLIYSVAREYYTYPVTREMAMYSLLPIDYFGSDTYGYVDREQIQNLINNALNFYIYQYCDDYVEQEQYRLTHERDLNVGAELDLMLLDMDDEDNGNPFGEELEDPDEDFEDEEYREDNVLDEYEFDDVDPEIFEDPTLMVKWLEKKDATG